MGREIYNGGPHAQPPERSGRIHRGRVLASTAVGLSALVASIAQAEPSAPSFGECESIVTDQDLRAQVTRGARTAMRSAAESVDYEEIVKASWAAVRFDLKFTRIVDTQIAILRQDRAYLERLLDGNIPSRAEEMAQRTTEAVFNSPEFQALQIELQEQVGQRLEPRVAGADLETHTRVAECIQVFLGQRYASTVSDVFSEEARAARVELEELTSGAGTSAALSLAGVVAAMLTIIFRRLVRRVVATVVRRLAGALAARLAAWASVVVGVALLAYELVAGADGVFPLIREELTSPETKQTIQRSLIEELSRATPEQLDARADEIAGTMINRWRQFKSNHRAVLELAARDEGFRQFLEDQPPRDFERLSVVVKAIKAMPPGGDEAVLDLLNRGLLTRALELPSVERLIEAWAPHGVSLADLLVWRDRTGDRFEEALANRLPAYVTPDELPDEVLDRLLSFDDARAAGRIAAMREPSRSEALQLDTKQLLALTAQFDDRQLSGLFDSLRPASSRTARAKHLRTIQRQPSLISRLDNAGKAIAMSAEPALALEILLGGSHPLPPIEQLAMVYERRVSPRVLVHRYGWGLAIVVGVPLMFVLWLLHGVGRIFGFLLFRGRR